MRFLSNKPHLRAAALTASAMAVGGTVLAGCGGSGSTLSSLPLNGSSNPGGPNPFPTPNPRPTGSATPNPNPTPNPTPSTSPTPNPTPSPGTGTGTLFDVYTNFTASANDTFTYQFTSTTTLNPDPNDEGDTFTSQGTVRGGTLFGTGGGGQKTTVTLNLPRSGSRTVTREEVLSGNEVVAYNYYTENASGRTDYGSDDLFGGRVTSSSRFDDGAFIPFNLAPGQSFSKSFTDFETEFDQNGAVTLQYNFVQQERITFVGNETTTVAGGTYSNTAHLRVELSYTDPAVSTGSTDQPTTETRDLYLSRFVGLVLATNKSVTQNVVGTLDSNGNNYTYTETEDGRSELISATVNGTNYPPGRSVSTFGASTSKPVYLSWHAVKPTGKKQAAKK